jgi:hypothetical protein
VSENLAKGRMPLWFGCQDEGRNFGGKRTNESQIGIHEELPNAWIRAGNKRCLSLVRLHERDGFLERSGRHNAEAKTAGNKRRTGRRGARPGQSCNLASVPIGHFLFHVFFCRNTSVFFSAVPSDAENLKRADRTLKTRKGHKKVTKWSRYDTGSSQEGEGAPLPHGPHGPHKGWAAFLEKVREELGWTLDETCDFCGVEIGWLKKARDGQNIRGAFREKLQDALNKKWRDRCPGKLPLAWPDWVDSAPWSAAGIVASPAPVLSATRVVSKPLTVDWVLFAPFCPGDSPRSVAPPNGLVCKAEDDESRTFVASANTRAELRWFDWGAAVWTLRTLAEFPNLAALAAQRRHTYRDLLKGQHLVRHLTELVNIAAKTRVHGPPSCQTHIGYALSMFSLVEPGWQSEFTPHALQVLSCPNLILKLPEIEDSESAVEDVASADEIRERESEILQHGVGTLDLHEFSQPGLVHGYACWAGVAAHINEALRPRMLNSCICFQQELQALWWRLHSLSASLNTRRPTHREAEQMNKLKVAVLRILRIGPTEVTALRLFKEAVIATSRFKSVFEEFQEIHRAMRNIP